MKAQIFSSDFVFALIIFFVIIGLASYFWLSMPESAYQLQQKANMVSEYLISKWGDENIITCSSLYDFATKEYDELRTGLNAKPYDVWIELKNLTPSMCPILQPKLDVLLNLDRSGSMSGQKLTDAKSASKFFVDRLNISDQAGLVSYSTTATLDQTLLVMTASNKTVLKSKIDALYASGYTDVGDAIGLSTTELTSARARSGKDLRKIQILLSDGNPNRPTGVDPIQYSIDKAKEACRNKIKIYTISLGTDANRVLMQEIARITGGKEYYAPTSGQLQEIFDTINKEITAVSEYGKAAHASVKNIASVTRIVDLNGQKLQLLVRVYETLGAEKICE